MNHKPSILFLLALLAACDKSAPPTPPPRPALVMTVQESRAEDSMSLAGEVVPRYESSQGFRIGGKIIERLVEVGTPVKKGQILAKLDPKDPQLAVQASQADIQAAEASVALAKAEVERYRQLALKKFVSASALDVKEAELKTARARVAQLKAQAGTVANRAGYALLAAARHGVVTQIRAEPGQVVEAGDLIAQIAGTDEIEVLVNAPEARMAEIRPRAPVRIRLWAHPEKIYSGTVREISPTGNSATRTFNVRVRVNEPDSNIRLGMTARAGFGAGHAAIIIPGTALTELNGKKTVWIIDSKNTAQPREVTAGQFGESGVEITRGLNSGERIAVAGVHTLTAGQTVRPVAASSAQ